jgi:hypothetical protein
MVVDTLRTMKLIPHDLKCSLYWFVNSISKGLLDNPAWELDTIDEFNSGQLNWDEYLATINDPTIISTAFTIWMNNIQMDDDNIVQNEEHATFRAFQYLRQHFDHRFTHDDIQPPFTEDELDEPQF